MAARKRLTTRALTQETLLISMQREVIPYLQQTGDLVDKLAPVEPSVIVGSLSGSPGAVLAQILAALSKAGVLKNGTTP